MIGLYLVLGRNEKDVRLQSFANIFKKSACLWHYGHRQNFYSFVHQVRLSGMKLTMLARLGYFSRAVVYLLIGLFAVLVTFGSSAGQTTDSKGALRHLLEQPFGSVLLLLLALGLFCYAIWRFAESFFDLNQQGKSAKGIVKRVGYFFGGLTHSLLGVYALRLIAHLSSQGTSEKGVARQLLALPFGQWVTGVVALIILGFGVSQIWMGIQNKFLKELSLPLRLKGWLGPICKIGFMARGLVFMLIGGFFLRAAFYSNSAEAGGITKAWNVLREAPYGNFLILVVAIGFIAFAIYGFAESRYQRLVQSFA